MPCKVLVVDDEEQVRGLFCDLLKRQNCSVQSASSGEEAIEIIGKEDFNLVLLDIKLTGMSGFQALKKIKELRPSVIAVMITGFGYNEDFVAKAKECGSSGYVGKNMPTSEIVGVLKYYIEVAQEQDNKQ